MLAQLSSILAQPSSMWWCCFPTCWHSFQYVVVLLSSMLAQPSSMLAQPFSMLAQPSSMLAQPSNMLAQPSSMLAQLSSMLAQLSSMLAQPSSMLAQLSNMWWYSLPACWHNLPTWWYSFGFGFDLDRIWFLSAAPKQAPQLSLVRRLTTPNTGRNFSNTGRKPVRTQGENRPPCVRSGFALCSEGFAFGSEGFALCWRLSPCVGSFRTQGEAINH